MSSAFRLLWQLLIKRGEKQTIEEESTCDEKTCRTLGSKE